jgi:DNA-binding IclR family transcriptional regulator
VGEILDLGGQEEDPLQRLRQALGKPETPGIIAMRLGCPLSEALSLLALLEIEGVVTRAGGGRFALRS